MKHLKTLFLLAGLFLLMTLPAQAQLSMLFDNNSSLADSNVWISIARPATSSTFGVTYGNGGAITWGTTNLFTTGVDLATLKANGGYSISNVISAGFYVSYGSAITNLTTAPSPIATNDKSYNIPYQNFELTRIGNIGDQGDITAINWYSANLGITSYHGGTNGTQLQSVGMNQPTATVLGQLAALNPSAVQRTLTNAQVITRVLGPTAYPNGSIGSYASLGAYLGYVSSNNITTTFANSSAFTVGGAGTNYSFAFNLSTTVNSNGVITGMGAITQTQTAGGSSNQVFSNVVIQFTGGTNADPALGVTTALYSGNPGASTNIIFSGAGWAAASNSFTTIYGTNTGTANFLTVQAQAAGEVSAGFLSGLVGSTNIITIGGVTTNVGSFASSNWWSDPNIPVFSGAQTNTNYYSQYGNIIYQNSSNTVYGFPYSDRWQQANALVNAVNYNGTNVDTWLINVGAPVSASAVPEPSNYSYLILGLIALPTFMVMARRSRKYS